ncbi:hypothetical protein EP331_03545 [bacterium]|nr:MAG: hypothetical protein EP331_03545 [bacterium]
MKKLGLIILGALIVAPFAKAQENGSFTVDGQLFNRTEVRHGFGLIPQKEEDPALLAAQRLRLGFNYKEENLTIYGSVQDIRYWGSTPQIKANDPFLSVHEAYAEYRFNEAWSMKLGRQELNYDNFRFLGNLDWALQGRAHDIALLKWKKENIKVDLGLAYNVVGDQLKDGPYILANQYKNAQFLRAEHTKGDFKTVFLVWNDGRQDAPKWMNSQINETNYMTTVGLPEVSYKMDNLKFTFFGYYQFGSDQNGLDVKAFDVSLEGNMLTKMDEGKSFSTTLGFELLSGTDAADVGVKNNSFQPLYGTNHRFNGFMDFFYVGGRNPAQGLVDVYSLNRFNFASNKFMILGLHYFMSHAESNIEKFLGVEADLSFGWVVNKTFSIQAGYSHLFAGENLAILQGNTNPSNMPNWAYVMLIFRPHSAAKFIGLKW